MKAVMSLRLSEEARKRLAEMAVEQKLSTGRIVENLILGDPPEMVTVEPPRLSPGGRGATVKVSRRPIQDISATKKVIERSAKAGRPEQGKTTVTGIPFGPVPK